VPRRRGRAANLWPQPINEAHEKDALEEFACRDVLPQWRVGGVVATGIPNELARVIS
jgi:hypothetical protein